MLLTQTDIEIAPSLAGDSIGEAAEEVIRATRGLRDSVWASMARAWTVSYLFQRMEEIFASGEEPVGAMRRALNDVAEFFLVAQKTGYASLGNGNNHIHSSQDNSAPVEQVTGFHYGRLFKDFASTSFWDEPVRLLGERLNRNEIEISDLGSSVVLDAGCGGGRYTVAWKLLGAKRAVGLDISSIGVLDAQRRIGEAGISDVEFREGSVLDLPFAENSFDIVFSNGVLHHTSDWKRGVEELVRVLRPGGIGWLYLIEDPGGLFWDLIEVLRVVMRNESREVARTTLQNIGIPANRIFYMLDHVMVPINLRLKPEAIQTCLREAGATDIRRLTRGTDFDRIERIYQGEPYAAAKYGVGENRYIFTKP